MKRMRKPDGWPRDLAYPADRHAVRAAIYRRGYTLTSLAKLHGLCGSNCRLALHRPASGGGEQAIAGLLGVERSALFDPGFWDRGKPKKKVQKEAA